MLGTRIILMGMDGMPGSLNGEPNAEMLCAANHAIPLFWLLAFDLTEIDLYTVNSNESDPVLSHAAGAKYPILIGYTADLVVRLKQRYSYLEPKLSEGDAELLKRWVTFISKHEAPVMAIDTYELWCNMLDSDALHQDISALLACFNSIDDSTVQELLDKLIKDGRWLAGNSIALTGFGW